MVLVITIVALVIIATAVYLILDSVHYHAQKRNANFLSHLYGSVHKLAGCHTTPDNQNGSITVRGGVSTRM